MTMPTAASCPTCGREMTFGVLAFWGQLGVSTVNWVPAAEAPRSRMRMREPASSERVIWWRRGADDPRGAWRCAACTTVVIPPDLNYDAR